MKKYLPVLRTSPLFSGIQEDEMEPMLNCLLAREFFYHKNDFILRFGENTDKIGIVLSGKAHVIREDFWGNRNIIAQIPPGQAFAESYACVQSASLGVSVVASEACRVLFLDVGRILTTCSSNCVFHARLIRNLLSILADKNLKINEKLSHMAQRTTREKLLSYLSAESLRQGKAAFDIPFNRQELADYLSVDRSALSAELSRMQRDKLLTFQKNHFHLLVE